MSDPGGRSGQGGLPGREQSQVQLCFGTSVYVPGPSLGLMFQACLPLHVLYSKVLVYQARTKLLGEFLLAQDPKAKP